MICISWHEDDCNVAEMCGHEPLICST